MNRARRRRAKLGLSATAAAVITSLAGFASEPAVQDNDPYESFNRSVFDFNISLDKAVMRPTAEFYNHVVPEKGRTGVHNVLSNLNEPVVFADQLLHGKLHDSGGTLVRAVLNSSVNVCCCSEYPHGFSNEEGVT